MRYMREALQLAEKVAVDAARVPARPGPAMWHSDVWQCFKGCRLWHRVRSKGRSRWELCWWLGAGS